MISIASGTTSNALIRIRKFFWTTKIAQDIKVITLCKGMTTRKIIFNLRDNVNHKGRLDEYRAVVNEKHAVLNLAFFQC